MRRAKAGAIESGATIGTSSYNEALRSEAEAARLAATEPREAAVPKYWAAEEQFRTAAEDTRRELAARKALPPAPPAADKNPSADTNAAPVATAGPVAKPSQEEPPRHDASAAQERAADEQAIRTTLQKYAEGYKRLSAAAVKAVYPKAPSQLLSRFSQYRSYDMQIQNHQISIDGARATVACNIDARITLNTGATTSQRASTTFRLEKTGNTWYIVARDLQ